MPSRSRQHGRRNIPNRKAGRFRRGRLSPLRRAAFQNLSRTFAAVRDPSAAEHPFATTQFPTATDGIIRGFPITDYAPPVRAFWNLVENARLAAPPFDWSEWLEGICESSKDPLDPRLVAMLSPTDLRRYLTMLQRAERFVEGTWGAALRNGVFDALLTRILSLSSTRDWRWGTRRIRSGQARNRRGVLPPTIRRRRRREAHRLRISSLAPAIA